MEDKKATRDLQFSIKASKEEKELAEKVAKARGLGVSALFRTLVADDARRLGIS